MQYESVVTRRFDVVVDIQAPSRGLESHRPTVQGRRVEPFIAVVFRTPGERRAVVGVERDEPRIGGSHPQEGAAGTRLIAPSEEQGVVRARRSEVGTPLGFPVVTVRAGVGEDVDSVVADLD